jgi:hypothetical protein
MLTSQDLSSDFMLTLSEEERSQLQTWLEQELRNKLVEEHRTDHAEYRKIVVHQEEILENIIHKLRRD